MAASGSTSRSAMSIRCAYSITPLTMRSVSQPDHCIERMSQMVSRLALGHDPTPVTNHSDTTVSWRARCVLSALVRRPTSQASSLGSISRHRWQESRPTSLVGIDITPQVARIAPDYTAEDGETGAQSRRYTGDLGPWCVPSAPVADGANVGWAARIPGPASATFRPGAGRLPWLPARSAPDGSSRRPRLARAGPCLPRRIRPRRPVARAGCRHALRADSSR